MFFSQPLHFVTHTLTNLIPLMPYTPSLGSNGPYSSVLGIHFTTRVAPMTVRREHNNGISSVRVDTDKRQRTQPHYHRPEKSGSNTIKGEGDALLKRRRRKHSNIVNGNNVKNLKVNSLKVNDLKVRTIIRR